MLREVWRDAIYNPEGFELHKTDTVVDIGANVGVFSVYAAARATSGRILAYEPVPVLYNLLAENFRLNHIRNANPVQMGVLDHEGEGFIWCDPKNLGGHSMFRGRVTAAKLERIPIQVTTLDGIFRSHHLDRIDFLKVDCEGSEYRILEAANDHTIQRIGRISLEYHLFPELESGPLALSRRLKGQGFKVTTRATDEGTGMLWARQSN